VPIALLFILSLNRHAVGDERPDPNLKAILARLASRQEKIQTGRFEFTEEVTIPKGSVGLRMYPWAMKSAPKGPIPAETLTHHKKWGLSFSNDGIRCSYKGPEWATGVDDFVQQSYVQVYRRDETRFYYKNAYGEHPLGLVYENNVINANHANLHLQPVLRHFRAFHASMGRIVPMNCTLKPAEGEIENHRCVILQHKINPLNETFWLDKDRDFVILRIELAMGLSPPHERLDVAYSLDKAHGWIPTSWRGVWNYSFDNGKTQTLMESFVATVTKYEINPQLKPEEFELTFPPATKVEDHYRKKGYIVGRNGEQLPITDDDRRMALSYRELLELKYGNHSHSWIWYGDLAGVVFIIALLFCRRKIGLFGRRKMADSA
jgi:hypothetical protein